MSKLPTSAPHSPSPDLADLAATLHQVSQALLALQPTITIPEPPLSIPGTTP